MTSVAALASFLSIAAAAPQEDLAARAVEILRNVMTTEQEWVKVHAAESLLWTGHREGVVEAFRPDQATAQPPYRIGVWRVLAQALPARRQEHVQNIAAVFLTEAFSDRLHAVETLAKLKYQDRPDELLRVAKEETGSFKACALWALANSGDAEDEARLAALLEDDDAAQRSIAAYALRHLKSLRPETLTLLRQAASAEAQDSPARANLLSALYMHAPVGEKSQVREQLVPCLESGDRGQKREICAVLGRVGAEDSLPLVEPLLDDPDADVRSGAAEAVLMILE